MLLDVGSKSLHLYFLFMFPRALAEVLSFGLIQSRYPFPVCYRTHYCNWGF